MGNCLLGERVGAQRHEDIEPALADGPFITHQLSDAVEALAHRVGVDEHGAGRLRDAVPGEQIVVGGIG